jgi:hypothetical protein
MTPNLNASVRNEFRPNDVVRLLDRHGELPSGAAGHIVGWFAREEPTYVVSFDGRQPCVVVRSDEIVLEHDLRRSA